MCLILVCIERLKFATALLINVRRLFKGDWDFTIINYDGVGIVKDEIMSAGYDLIVVDECNAYKTHTTARWKALYLKS